ncbi:MAG: GH116 family glycosyl-hydrolase, partial [Planctomycetota bacterium]|nr:GH116 family glycosyl-hydrolase [Planctomycetota bacterium]
MAQQNNGDECGTGCGCGGLGRREFLKAAATGLGAVTMGMPIGQTEAAAAAVEFEKLMPADKKLPPEWVKTLVERGVRKIYRDKELETIGMPCGGIAAGQLYVRGDGTLGRWWIFNRSPNTAEGDRCYTTYRPASPIAQGFAVCVKGADGKAVVKKLSREDFDAIEFVGEYPIAEIRYGNKGGTPLPVAVSAEVFSPFIPLNARDSAMPVTVLRYTVKNTSGQAVEAAIGGWLQNGVCLDYAGTAGHSSTNRVVREGGLTSVRMDLSEKQERPAERRVSVFEDFEDGTYGKWEAKGDAFGKTPATGKSETQQEVSGWIGKYFVNTFRPDDRPQGTLLSKPFRIKEPFITFLIGGGSQAGATCMNLLVDGKVVRTATGKDAERLLPGFWSVSDLMEKEARLEIVDKASGPWGHINVDQICFSNT